jgi:dTDP-4-dehydrorhamnose 3,5-epimerase-like enzyme
MSPKDGFLYIPPNFANGAMNLTEDNAIRYYSSSTLEESLNDDFRFESDYWDPWSQHNPNFYE